MALTMRLNKKISQKDQLLVITSAIILAGMAANYSTVSPSSTHTAVARVRAKELLDDILKR